MYLRMAALLAVGALVGSALVEAQLVPAGPEFQVNTHVTSNQEYPDVGRDASGNFVIVWQSESSPGDDSSSFSIQGRRFLVDGTPIGDQFQINTTTLSGQLRPKVAIEGDGGFVVVWQSYSVPSTTAWTPAEEGFPTTVSIVGRRYDASGMPIGADFRVDTLGVGNRFYPDVASDTNGGFVVVWSGRTATDPDPNEWGIAGRRYDSSGLALGDEFTLHTETDGRQDHPAIAMGGAGDFVTVWQSRDNPFYGDEEIRSRRFDSNGMPLGNEFEVNSFTSYDQIEPAVARASGGAFIVAWEASYGGSPGNDPGQSIVARRFSSLGMPQGNDFQVNSYTTGFQYRPAIATDEDGSFVVVWTSPGSFGDDTDYSIQARQFAANGTARGAEFQVNSYTTDSQGTPAVEFLEAGHMIVTWTSFGSFGDFSGASVLAQRFGPPEIFADGFESGDVSLWTNAVP